MDAARSSANPMLCFNPAECQPKQIYKLMTGMIVPRPVALVSTMSRDGVANLAPFSFFCGVGSAPPTVLFCPALRSADYTQHRYRCPYLSGSNVGCGVGQSKRN